MRILITGSRDWDNLATIQIALEEIHRSRVVDQRLSQDEARNITLVSGACPTGADKMCEWVAEQIGWVVERHPADWRTQGKRAGFVRNAEMVKLGADVCLAFIKNNSKGATMTANLAENAGIEVRRFEVSG